MFFRRLGSVTSCSEEYMVNLVVYTCIAAQALYLYPFRLNYTKFCSNLVLTLLLPSKSRMCILVMLLWQLCR